MTARVASLEVGVHNTCNVSLSLSSTTALDQTIFQRLASCLPYHPSLELSYGKADSRVFHFLISRELHLTALVST